MTGLHPSVAEVVVPNPQHHAARIPAAVPRQANPHMPIRCLHARPICARLSMPDRPLPRRARLPLPPPCPRLPASCGALAPPAQTSGIQTKKPSRPTLPSRLAVVLPHSLHICLARRHATDRHYGAALVLLRAYVPCRWQSHSGHLSHVPLKRRDLLSTPLLVEFHSTISGHGQRVLSRCLGVPSTPG
jgi:hypothetical protein